MQMKYSARRAIAHQQTANIFASPRMLQWSAADVARMLAARIDELVPEILPNAKIQGAEWVVGSLAGEPGKSLCIHRYGAKAGVCADFAGPFKGDALDLVAHTLFAGDKRQARRWALRWLGLNDTTHAPILRAAPPPPRPAQAQDNADNVERALRIWSEAAPGHEMVRRYLASRGLVPPPIVDVLRYHPRCPLGAERRPAMIALMTDARTEAPTGIHRTFLRPDGTGKADDLPPKRAKRMLGHAGVIRLVDDAEVTLTLGIGEGIETSLAVMQPPFEFRHMWACGYANGVGSFPLLDGLESLWVFADADANGSGQDAAREVGLRYASAGREVRIVTPRRLNDWNDVLTKEIGA